MFFAIVRKKAPRSLPEVRTKLTGLSLIGFRDSHGSGQPLYAADPRTGPRLEPAFIPVTREEVKLAVRLAADAFTLYD